MAQCGTCKNETELYANGVPLCLACENYIIQQQKDEAAVLAEGRSRDKKESDS